MPSQKFQRGVSFPRCWTARISWSIARPGTSLDDAAARTPALRERLHRLGDTIPQDGNTRIILVEARTRDISSTMIRARLTARQPIDRSGARRRRQTHRGPSSLRSGRRLAWQRLRRVKRKRVVRLTPESRACPRTSLLPSQRSATRRPRTSSSSIFGRRAGSRTTSSSAPAANTRQMTAIADSVQDTLRRVARRAARARGGCQQVGMDPARLLQLRRAHLQSRMSRVLRPGTPVGQRRAARAQLTYAADALMAVILAPRCAACSTSLEYPDTRSGVRDLLDRA